MRSRHSFIVTVEQRDDLEPVTEAELMLAVGYRITEGCFIDLIEIVPTTVVLEKDEE